MDTDFDSVGRAGWLNPPGAGLVQPRDEGVPAPFRAIPILGDPTPPSGVLGMGFMLDWDGAD